MTSASLIPSADLVGEEALRTLGKNFKLNEQVVQHLIKAQIENLDEFRFLLGQRGKGGRMDQQSWHCR